MKRRGVILMEVIIALFITGLVLAAGGFLLQTLFQTVASSHRAIQANRELSSVEGRLREIARSAVFDSVSPALGDSLSFFFQSRCLTRNGWSQACRVALAANGGASHDSSQTAIELTLSTGDTVRLGRGPGIIRYLIDAQNGGIWASVWRAPDRLPVGFVLISNLDSLFVRMGASFP